MIVGLFFHNVSFEKLDTEDEIPTSYLLTEKVTEDLNSIRTEYFDQEGNLAYADDKYYALKIETLDASGNVILEEYFDEVGKPAKQKLGHYQLKKEYNDLNQNIKMIYLNQEGKIIKNKSGYSIVKKEYNGKNLVSKETYYDKEENPVLNTAKYHGKLMEYNDLDQEYKCTYVDLDNMPTMISSKYSIVKREFNIEGKVSKEMYYDTSGKPAQCSSGYYGVLKEYDIYERNNVSISLDENEKPYINDCGYTRMEKTFFKNKEFKAGFYQDLDGNPIKNKNGNYGVNHLNQKKWIYFDQNQREVLSLQKFLTNNPIVLYLIILLIVLVSILLPKKGIYIGILLSILTILYLTILTRSQSDVEPHLELFWSYKKFFSAPTLRQQIFQNIALFVPLGYLLSFVTKKKRWLIFPIVLSIGIELSQLVFELGYFEFDDIFNNSLGSILGFYGGRFIIFLKNKYLIEKK